MRSARAVLLSLIAAASVGCTPGGQVQNGGSEEASAVVSSTSAEVLRREVARIDSAAAAIDSIFQPLPLLTPAEEAGLQQYGNNQQLARARALGVGRELSTEALQSLESEGRLLRLEDSQSYVIRDLDYSAPLAVPAVDELLTEIGSRFQERLGELGAPPFRLEVTSVLRGAADQAALRQVNPNAALGESTHEYGTTVDVLYSAYSAPTEPIVEVDVSEEPDLEPFLRRYADIAAERVAARRALELKAILGEVLLEMQDEGRVMVTLERQQPVYHMTVAR
ncbi:MAG: hypothetical protein GEU90_13695 [Gemmatimonas sp.]|nr:hypothetical protein [Gemmatimonas sp.]